MNIVGVTRTQGVYQPNISKGTQKNKGRANDNQGVLELSSSAKDYQLTRIALANVPDIRQDKVDEVTQKIKSGVYNISASDVADKLTRAISGM